MDLNIYSNEIFVFLSEIKLHLISELNFLDYENTGTNNSNEETYRKLLNKCEQILGYLEKDEIECSPVKVSENEAIECSYLDMSTKKTSKPSEYVFVSSPSNSVECENVGTDKNDGDIYDICAALNQQQQQQKQQQQQQQQQQPQQTTPENINSEDTVSQDCPYSGLPAAHLSIKKSLKYGILLRIEKRLFFDQTKRYYCGILDDCLLCYSDGLNAMKPSFCINLNNADIEHFGEGKRRELYFQITTKTSNNEISKKYIFQTNSEINAKEWIHAIEGSIRGDFCKNFIQDDNSLKSPNKLTSVNNNLRKLPTPPLPIRMYNNNSDHINTTRSSTSEDIYEEPCPFYNNTSSVNIVDVVISGNVHEKNSNVHPDLPKKVGKSEISIISEISKTEYDVPKSSQKAQSFTNQGSKSDNSSDLVHTNIEFQSKIKDVHDKLSNQLLPAAAAGLIASSDIKIKKEIRKQHQTDSKKMNDKKPKTPEKPPTPIKKNWFRNRLNKSSVQPTTVTNSTSLSKPNSLPSVKSLEIGDREIETPLKQNVSPSKFTSNSSVKGSKVNMIINQLEANGHHPMFSKNFDRLSTLFSVEQNDDCNYEPISSPFNVKI